MHIKLNKKNTAPNNFWTNKILIKSRTGIEHWGSHTGLLTLPDATETLSPRDIQSRDPSLGVSHLGSQEA
jgi:hypothetical protein